MKTDATDTTLPLQFDPQKLGIQPPPTRRFDFPITRNATNKELFVGCMVAMQETGNNGIIVRANGLHIIEAKTVKVTITPLGGASPV